ncbi:MAG: transposase [Desulfobacterales bacterium]|jgi:REP element-mobilizing transposase RayT|nr:transposase [Desulfobacterales bacterium]
MRPLKGSQALRKGRFSIGSQPYLVTTTVHQRQVFLQSEEAAEIVLSSLLWLENEKGSMLSAAVVMPDHVHFVVELGTCPLPQLVHSFKSFTANRINRLLDRSGPFWQAQYHDHAIRRDEVLNDVVLYLLNNPVRAGLVTDFHDWPFWYCKWKI